MILNTQLVYLLFVIVNYFTILYNTLIYNDFDSIREYPALFFNYISLIISVFTVYLYSKKILSVLNRRKLYYISLGYNIVLYLFLNIAVWITPNYFYNFKTTQRDLFKDHSYLSYLLSIVLLTLTIISILRKEYYKYKEVIRYITII